MIVVLGIWCTEFSTTRPQRCLICADAISAVEYFCSFSSSLNLKKTVEFVLCSTNHARCLPQARSVPSSTQTTPIQLVQLPPNWRHEERNHHDAALLYPRAIAAHLQLHLLRLWVSTAAAAFCVLKYYRNCSCCRSSCKRLNETQRDKPTAACEQITVFSRQHQQLLCVLLLVDFVGAFLEHKVREC